MGLHHTVAEGHIETVLIVHVGDVCGGNIEVYTFGMTVSSQSFISSANLSALLAMYSGLKALIIALSTIPLLGFSLTSSSISSSTF